MCCTELNIGVFFGGPTDPVADGPHQILQPNVRQSFSIYFQIKRKKFRIFQVYKLQVVPMPIFVLCTVVYLLPRKTRKDLRSTHRGGNWNFLTGVFIKCQLLKETWNFHFILGQRLRQLDRSSHNIIYSKVGRTSLCKLPWTEEIQYGSRIYICFCFSIDERPEGDQTSTSVFHTTVLTFVMPVSLIRLSAEA